MFHYKARGCAVTMTIGRLGSRIRKLALHDLKIGIDRESYTWPFFLICPSAVAHVIRREVFRCENESEPHPLRSRPHTQNWQRRIIFPEQKPRLHLAVGQPEHVMGMFLACFVPIHYVL